MSSVGKNPVRLYWILTEQDQRQSNNIIEIYQIHLLGSSTVNFSCLDSGVDPVLNGGRGWGD